MSDELKAAAERLREPIYPATVSACDHIWNAHGQCQWCKWMRRDVDVAELSRAVLYRIAADEAEKVERDRAIDEEWLTSIGWEFRGVFWYYQLQNKRQLVMSQKFGISDVLIKNVASPQFVGIGKYDTRGQLLDLIKAVTHDQRRN